MFGRFFAGLILVSGVFAGALAQTEAVASKGLTVLGLLSLPTGSFVSEDDESGAETGYGAGIEYVKPVPAKNLEFVLGAYFIHNPVDVSAYENSDVSASADGWRNISLLGGARIPNVAGIPGLYVQGMAGLNRASPGDIKITNEYDGTRERWTASIETSLALGFGVGRKFGKWDVGVRYLNFGEPDFDEEVEIDDGYSDLYVFETEFGQEISMFVMTVGYSF